MSTERARRTVERCPVPDAAESRTAEPHETWTSHECAAVWGVRTPTWLGYVSRGQAPPPLPELDEQRRRRWDPSAVRDFPRPGAGRSRSGAGPDAEALMAEMAEVTVRIDELRARQRELARTGKELGVEIRAMARTLKVSPQTLYGWLDGPTATDP